MHLEFSSISFGKSRVTCFIPPHWSSHRVKSWGQFAIKHSKTSCLKLGMHTSSRLLKIKPFKVTRWMNRNTTENIQFPQLLSFENFWRCRYSLTQINNNDRFTWDLKSIYVHWPNLRDSSGGWSPRRLGMKTRNSWIGPTWWASTLLMMLKASIQTWIPSLYPSSFGKALSKTRYLCDNQFCLNFLTIYSFSLPYVVASA